ncbi:MAG: LysE family translocator [Gammaproteobacteria bacterium]|nr:LysE family translocator [Gammaproteobacteria bacterium]
MEQYLLYLIMVILTVSIPGPGVVLTLSNALRHGIKPALSGVIGISLGILIISIVSASSLGVLLTTSSIAFSILKFIGAGYLIYLGIKLWRTPVISLEGAVSTKTMLKEIPYWRSFKEGFFVSLLNPKAIFFFMALFPQFINHKQSYLFQFTYLTLTFCFVIIVVHTIYILGANSIKSSLSSPRGYKIVNRTSGSVFVLFGLGLAISSQSNR